MLLFNNFKAFFYLKYIKGAFVKSKNANNSNNDTEADEEMDQLDENDGPEEEEAEDKRYLEEDEDEDEEEDYETHELFIKSVPAGHHNLHHHHLAQNANNLQFYNTMPQQQPIKMQQSKRVESPEPTASYVQNKVYKLNGENEFGGSNNGQDDEDDEEEFDATENDNTLNANGLDKQQANENEVCFISKFLLNSRDFF